MKRNLSTSLFFLVLCAQYCLAQEFSLLKSQLEFSRFGSEVFVASTYKSSVSGLEKRVRSSKIFIKYARSHSCKDGCEAILRRTDTSGILEVVTNTGSLGTILINGSSLELPASAVSLRETNSGSITQLNLTILEMEMLRSLSSKGHCSFSLNLD